ncbi:MAG: group III truncated hemoglobin [Bacteroidetes bacterium]|nr:group III truncated hemoglobin [Bacteroidota bacterium]
MKTDIKNRQDISEIIHTFYDKVKIDEEIGFFFSAIIPVNWDQHLPIMVDFWENIVFNTGNYKGNPMPPHIALHQKSAMKPEHFNHWIELFTKTVDDLFEGPNATTIKQRAMSIATVMQIKILNAT